MRNIARIENAEGNLIRKTKKIRKIYMILFSRYFPDNTPRKPSDFLVFSGGCKSQKRKKVLVVVEI